MAGITDQIRDWATQLPYWEQACLEKVVSEKPVSESDYQELLSFLLQDAGLQKVPPTPRKAFTFPAKLRAAVGTKKCIIERLFNLRHVNALPAGQEVNFGPQLTIVYGANGSGKTSYTRSLGCAAFARGEREVLTDARKPQSDEVPEADISIKRDGNNETVHWTNGKRCLELAGVYVFDATSINAHLTGRNALSFSPSGLFLLTKMAEVTDSVRERLRRLIELRSVPHSFGQLFPGDSAVSLKISNLTEATDISELQTLAGFSAADEALVAELDQRLAILKSQNVAQTTATIRQETTDLQSLIRNLEATAHAVDAAATTEVNTLIGEFVARREEAQRVGADQFRFEQFTQVGTNTWREFIGKAKALADAEAQNRPPYPQENDHCLLCRQTLSLESIGLINRMWQFLSSDAPARFTRAQNECDACAQQLQRLNVSFFGTDSATHRILQTESPEAASAVGSHLEALSSRARDLQRALMTATSAPAGEMPTIDLTPIQAAIQHRVGEIGRLQATDAAKEIETVQRQLCEIQHRKTLSDVIPPITKWILDQNWAALARRAGGTTHHITAKYNELFALLVTDEYVRRFQETLNRLKPNLKVTVSTKGQKGETVREIVLSPDVFVQKVAIDRILSDGEKRTAALVDFLTEFSLDPHSSAIVLDDPVCSFDSDSKTAVAQLLAEQAASRQVIVFTHDLTFVYALKETADSLGLSIESNWVRCEAGEPGYVYRDNSPTSQGDYKSA